MAWMSDELVGSANRYSRVYTVHTSTRNYSSRDSGISALGTTKNEALCVASGQCGMSIWNSTLHSSRLSRAAKLSAASSGKEKLWPTASGTLGTRFGRAR